MAPFNQKSQRSITIQTLHVLEDGQDPQKFDWRTGGYLSFEVYEGYNAWYGRLRREEYRKDWPHDGVQNDLSRFDELVKLLQPIPKDKMYPLLPNEELTEYTLQQAVGNEAVYLKAPRPCHYRDNSNDLAVRLLNEARIHEKLRGNPHRNVDSYLGCVVEGGRIVRLALKRYSKSLYDYLQRETQEEFTSQQRTDCMDQIESAAKHLHSLGLAHNDISPSNIMFDNTGQPVLIDLDSCAPLGNILTKGGLVTGWKGPINGYGRQYDRSSTECDMEAIHEIRDSLMNSSTETILPLNSNKITQL